MSDPTTDPRRQPQMGEYAGLRQWNCQWPGCEFDTLDEAAWYEHIDPVTGAHRDPLGAPGVAPVVATPLDVAERAELDELRAYKAAAEVEAQPTEQPAPVEQLPAEAGTQESEA